MMFWVWFLLCKGEFFKGGWGVVFVMSAFYDSRPLSFLLTRFPGTKKKKPKAFLTGKLSVVQYRWPA